MGGSTGMPLQDFIDLSNQSVEWTCAFNKALFAHEGGAVASGMPNAPSQLLN